MSEFTESLAGVSCDGIVLLDSAAGEGGGSSPYVPGVSRDLTEEKCAREELTSVSSWLRTVFETTTDAIFVLDREWHFQVLNRRAFELLQAGRELVGHNVWEAFPELGDTEFGKAYRRAMESGERAIVTAEYEPLGIWIEARAFPSAEGLTIFFRDVTEKMQLEKDLQQSSDRLRLALDAGRVIAWEHDVSTRRITFSENVSGLLGMSSSCSLEEFRARIHPDDAELAKRALRKGSPARFRFSGPGGHEIWLSAMTAEGSERFRRYGTLSDVTDQEKAQARLWQAANYDDLTGLPNRAFLQAHLQAVLDSREPFSLLFLDLDNFKDVNDAEGHDAGDELLKEVARRVREFMSEHVFSARCGGDEFAMVMKGRSPAEVLKLVTSLLDKLRLPFHYKQRLFDCRASLGIAHSPVDGEDSFSLLKAADLALYGAKGEGRDCAKEYSAEMRAGVQRRVSVARQVRHAITENRILPYYQPKVCLLSGRVTGFEALVRMRVPGQVVSAQSFSEAFAYPDIASALTEKVLDGVISDISSWTDEGCGFGHVAINLGQADFTVNDIAAEIASRLNSRQIAGSLLQIEVTESVFLGRSEDRILSTLKRLKALGVTIALDDFGTGFASLTHLKRYPVDVVKIDQSFVRDMGENEHSRAIVAAIVGLGTSLGIQTVAEGIEDPGAVRVLRKLGCHTGQGYLFAKPMPASQVPGFLGGWSPKKF
ncbi:MAG: hypothetical protein JWL62_3730 [Hyphomicrobiales bacterium]|nr:hypothetical protein [Hyphomicrobiales bacterium]